MKRFIKILNWCNEHPLDNNGVYEIDDYVCEHLFEVGIDFPVSKDEIVCCYKILGYDVERTFNDGGGYCWLISTLDT